ncbi:DUF4097 family beta strand repeat-containing protein [Paenibacillus arenilitoris]|uniref:DUF4097 family beta strand repeat protein n=1 Tax=Paenibacillus arenilitoris TaxID=2772299 RepID=A0A927CJ60_9BACL|nr:DUF4097 family beta strand repeat-containing protein [Paenibacillus arenilitoris]MBD2868062.1 DUF4097 family beta strand repeat protein [Paenibacillus arenilitoris]
MKKLAAIALIMLGVGVIGAMVSFDWNDIRNFGTRPYLEERTVEAAGIDTINVRTSSIDVEVVRGKSDAVQIRLDGRASEKYLDRFELIAEQDDNGLLIEGTYKDMFFVGFNFVNVDLIVEIPDRLWQSLEVNSNSGNIDLENVRAASASAESGSGNLELENMQADDMSLKSGSGNIEVDGLTAKNVTLQTGSGGLEMENYTADQIKATSESGNITLENGQGAVQGRTDSGNIRLTADELLQDVGLKSDSGTVRIDLEKEPRSAAIRLRTESGNRKVEWESLRASVDNEYSLEGTIGSGETKIDVETDSGNLRLGLD